MKGHCVFVGLLVVLLLLCIIVGRVVGTVIRPF